MIENNSIEKIHDQNSLLLFMIYYLIINYIDLYQYIIFLINSKMMYCAMDEAFQPEATNNNYPNNTFNEKPYNYLKQQPSFFTAQGDLSGTNISDLKSAGKNDGVSILDSATMSDFYTEDYLDSEYKKTRSHNYYIDKFIKSITDDMSDIISIMSSHDNDTYEHIRTCKYCRTQIKNKMKEIILDEEEYKTDKKVVEKFNNNKSKNSISDGLSSISGSLGYELKEILIIILVGIILIFILDLLVKIGRKTNK